MPARPPGFLAPGRRAPAVPAAPRRAVPAGAAPRWTRGAPSRSRGRARSRGRSARGLRPRPPARAGTRRVVVRLREVRLLGEDALDLAPSLVALALLEQPHGQVEPRRRVLRVQLERAFASSARCSAARPSWRLDRRHEVVALRGGLELEAAADESQAGRAVARPLLQQPDLQEQALRGAVAARAERQQLLDRDHRLVRLLEVQVGERQHLEVEGVVRRRPPAGAATMSRAPQWSPCAVSERARLIRLTSPARSCGARPSLAQLLADLLPLARARRQVAERLQPRARLGVDRRHAAASGRAVPLQERGERRAHRRRLVGPRRGQVAQLLRVGGEVEQLGPGAVDVLPVPLEERAELAPVLAQAGRQGLGVVRPLDALGGAAGQQRLQAAALHVGGHRDVERVQHGRRHVHEAHAPGHPSARRHARAAHDERHVHRAVVQQVGVRQLVVLAHALAVVGRQHDQRAVVEAVALQPVEQRAEALVGVGDLAVVRPVREELVVGHRRVVRLVRVVVVDPQEERLALLRLVQPLEDRLVDARGAPLLEGERVALRRAGRRERAVVRGRQPVVVEVEALVETVARDQGEAADGRPGAVALRLQDLGERLLGGAPARRARCPARRAPSGTCRSGSWSATAR